jgi:hypothetical protein
MPEETKGCLAMLVGREETNQVLAEAALTTQPAPPKRLRGHPSKQTSKRQQEDEMSDQEDNDFHSDDKRSRKR